MFQGGWPTCSEAEGADSPQVHFSFKKLKVKWASPRLRFFFWKVTRTAPIAALLRLIGIGTVPPTIYEIKSKAGQVPKYPVFFATGYFFMSGESRRQLLLGPLGDFPKGF